MTKNRGVSPAPDPSGYYVVRCVVCGHKIGVTDDVNDTQDVCERCDD